VRVLVLVRLLLPPVLTALRPPRLLVLHAPLPRLLCRPLTASPRRLLLYLL
jgi:hypothetical protein